MRHDQGWVPQLYVEGIIERCATVEEAAAAALAELAALAPFRRAAVLGWREGSGEPRLLAVRPAATDEPEASPRELHSGSLMTLPLEVDGNQIGLLSVSPLDPEGLHRDSRLAANRIAERLARTLQRLEREAVRTSGAHPTADAHGRDELRARVEELETANERLRERNAELESFVQSVTHDLMSSVRTIRLTSEALLGTMRSHGVQDAGVAARARQVLETTRRLGRLVDDLSTYHRLGRVGMGCVALDMHEVVDEALAQLAGEIEMSGARVHVDPHLPEVEGHHATLVQAIMNLVSNALKFVVPGTVPEVHIGGSCRGGRVRLSVRDNGIGIPPEQCRRVFRAFARLHGADAYPGSGLGLAIVQRGVERLGGQVGVQSVPGQGSAFWLDLPAAAAPTYRQSAGHGPSRSTGTHG
jgi:signal transduction histidine kinase